MSTLYQRVFEKKKKAKKYIYWTKLFWAFTIRNNSPKLSAKETRIVIIVLDFPNLWRLNLCNTESKQKIENRRKLIDDGGVFGRGPICCPGLSVWTCSYCKYDSDARP